MISMKRLLRAALTTALTGLFLTGAAVSAEAAESGTSSWNLVRTWTYNDQWSYQAAVANCGATAGAGVASGRWANAICREERTSIDLYVLT